MSPVEVKKMPCCPVEFKGQGPLPELQRVLLVLGPRGGGHQAVGGVGEVGQVPGAVGHTTGEGLVLQ